MVKSKANEPNNNKVNKLSNKKNENIAIKFVNRMVNEMSNRNTMKIARIFDSVAKYFSKKRQFKFKDITKDYAILITNIYNKSLEYLKKTTASRKTGFNPVMLLILAIVTGFSMFTLRTNYINKRLNNQLAYFTSITNQQECMIEEFMTNDGTTNKKISEFSNKYRELADTYISGRLSENGVNRGEGGRSFVTDITDLKSILDELVKINAVSEGTVNKFTETETNIRNYINSMPDIWPAQGNITSYFGNRYVPYDYSYISHSGIDIAGGYGSPIIASASGYVIFASYYGGYGYTLIIDHGNGITTLYAHAAELYAQVGQYVNKGDMIATVGSSGVSTGSHLHFEIRVNGTPVEPLNYLQ